MGIPCDSPSDLLARIAALSRCVYLSDLRFLPVPCPTMRAVLHTVPAEAYTPRCWQAAVSYLTGRPAPPTAGSSTCRRMLLEYYRG